MHRLLIVLIAAMLVAACGAANPSTSSHKLDIKAGGKDATLSLKSGAVYFGNVISTSPGRPNIQTFGHTLYLANYVMDTSYPGWVRKPPASPENAHRHSTHWRRRNKG